MVAACLFLSACCVARLASALDVTICGGAPRRRPSCWLFVADRLWGSLVPSQRAPACSRAAFARVNQASREHGAAISLA